MRCIVPVSKVIRLNFMNTNITWYKFSSADASVCDKANTAREEESVHDFKTTVHLQAEGHYGAL